MSDRQATRAEAENAEGIGDPGAFAGVDFCGAEEDRQARQEALGGLAMLVLGGIVGAILGFLVGLLITEVIVGNPANGSGFDWQLWTDVVFIIVGALVGSSLARRFANRNAKAS